MRKDEVIEDADIWCAMTGSRQSVRAGHWRFRRMHDPRHDRQDHPAGIMGIRDHIASIRRDVLAMEDWDFERGWPMGSRRRLIHRLSASTYWRIRTWSMPESSPVRVSRRPAWRCFRSTSGIA
jgi:hypothetical protein